MSLTSEFPHLIFPIFKGFQLLPLPTSSQLPEHLRRKNSGAYIAPLGVAVCLMFGGCWIVVLLPGSWWGGERERGWYFFLKKEKGKGVKREKV